LPARINFGTMILAGDIGGTKTNLALFDDSVRLIPETQRKFSSPEHASLEEVLGKYRQEISAPISAAGFGIAGPVKDGVCKATNLPWEVHGGAIAALLKVSRVVLVNDLVANAAGIDVLPEGSFETLHAGKPDAKGNRAILSAGTGLGQASMVYDPHVNHHVAIASEGGHSDFAPRTELQVELRHYLTSRFGRAEWEQILSGPGFFNCYTFFRDMKKMEEPGWLRDSMSQQDKSAAVSIAALKNQAPIAVAAMELFVSCYGAQAGNVALGVVATSGVFLGGGIAPKILPMLKKQNFLDGFLDKGKMKDLMGQIPVRVILNADTALYGAASLAQR